MSEQNYHLRYSVQPWDKPVPPKARNGTKVGNGVTVSNDDYGYADDLLIASVIHDDAGKPASVLLFSEDGPNPSRALLELVRDAINHHLENHCDM